MTAEEQAFQAPEAKIAEAARTGAEGSSFDANAFRALTRLPPAVAALGARRRKSNRDLARKGGDLVDGMVVAPFGVPYHLALKLDEPLRALAKRFPTGFGWLTHWYDATFGQEGREDS